ncbi:helix-turn-helix transcriptional regulator [Saccharibacillus kuerlensis]|uniref:HTH araC/xylS-type domain-containing protein n=1 Tax=Saccharibacillus kuerlensis TaxID=459527 RepID=A0ABQ2KVM2_9BACL|nr:helix-turn-helix domain-containing protein [Saccharibacillus kuerlensis]GGN94793.1 hypothetical protein GCM10010969_09850 [Saccharibacillus kuerlensis]
MKKYQSVWARLAVSYLSIVLVIVLSLCSVFYLYSSNRYMDELQNRSQTNLANTAQTIDSVVLQRVHQTALKLALDKTSDLRQFQDHSWESQPARLLELQELLTSEVAGNPNLIEAIHLYDPRSGAMLSSQYGLVDQMDRAANDSPPADWIEKMKTLPQSSLWTASRLVPEDIFSNIPGGNGHMLMTYAHSYPFQSSGADSDLILAIDVKEDAIREILRNMMPFQYEETWTLGTSGDMVIGPAAQIFGTSQEAGSPAVDDLASFMGTSNLPTEPGITGGRTDSEYYTIFYEQLPTTGWMLYSAMPHSFFQEQSLTVQRIVLVISALALLIGLLLSGVMTKLIYSPLKAIVVRIRHLAGQPTESANEYGLIDTALSSLSRKVTTLEETLQETGPLVKRSLMLKLLEGDPAEKSPKERLLLSSLFGESGSFRCMLLQPIRASLPASEAHQKTPEQIASLLEQIDLQGVLIVAEEMPDQKVAAIIVRHFSKDIVKSSNETSIDSSNQVSNQASNKTSNEEMRALAQYVQEECERQLNIKMQLSWGIEVSRPEELHLSCGEAESYMKYAYFLPECAILHDPALLRREGSQEEIPQPILSRFKDKLPGRQFEEIVEAVDGLIEVIREGEYPADYCHFILSNTVFMYSDHLKSVRYRHSSGGHPDLHRQYIGLAHIDEFRNWLLNSVSHFLAETEKRNGERSLDTLESAKAYIEEHLSGDLSLEAVSSSVFISAKYLSRLFKEELGVTYTEYVTGRRMESAKILIERGGMTIEQIAGAVGYATPAYFIKKFKEAYGCTPGNYLRESLKQAKSS